MRIGVYVGSFDPVHNCHKEIVNHLLNKYVDKFIVVPTLNYWNKQNLTPLHHRTNMLKLVFNNKNVIIDDNLSKYKYTYEIMNELKNTYPEGNLYLIIGADNLENFNKWKNYKDILKNNILIIPRDKIDVNTLIEKYENKNKFIIVKDFTPKDISSTYIRKNIENNNTNDIVGLIDNKVLNYIVINKLYKSR